MRSIVCHYLCVTIIVSLPVLGLASLLTSDQVANINKQNVIYGQDDRREPFEVKNKSVRELSRSVLALVSANKLGATKGIDGWPLRILSNGM